MDAELTVSLVRDLTDEQYDACRALTLPRGSMCPALERIRSAMAPHVRNIWMLRALETETVLMLHAGGELVAWALVQCVNDRVAPKVYLYVREDRRRQGLGSRLLSETLERWPDAEVFPWDQGSLEFFERYPQPLAYNYESRRWIEDRGLVATSRSTRIPSQHAYA